MGRTNCHQHNFNSSGQISTITHRLKRHAQDEPTATPA